MGGVERFIDFEKIDRQCLMNKINTRQSRIDKVNYSLIKDCLANSPEMLKKLLEAYTSLEPNWVSKYNSIEEKKPKELQSPLKEDTTIEDILDQIEGANDEDTFMNELALSVVVSNRIAHSVNDIMKKRIDDYSKEKIDPKDKKLIMNYVRKKFGTSGENVPTSCYKNFKNICSIYGIDIDNFKKDEFDKLVKAEQIGFYLKEYSLQKLLTKLKDRDDINYGIKLPNIEEGETQKSFVMDLPYFGQFSVHLMDPKLEAKATPTLEDKIEGAIYSENKNMNKEINEHRNNILNLLSGRTYDLPLFEKKTIMLTSQTSDEGNKFLQELNGMTEKEKMAEIDKKSPRYSHYLKVKDGYDTRGDEHESRDNR